VQFLLEGMILLLDLQVEIGHVVQSLGDVSTQLVAALLVQQIPHHAGDDLAALTSRHFFLKGLEQVLRQGVGSLE
jgi:hypothetical protein